MNPREKGFLLLSSHLGDGNRKPLTTAQLRTLASRVQMLNKMPEDRELLASDLTALGYGQEMACRITQMLEDTTLLECYIRRGKQLGCMPVSRVSEAYPVILRHRLGLDAPGCLWLKGDPELLKCPMIALVGSRELRESNRVFAREAGRQAALQGFALVSGNARGADRAAQESCLEHGGQVICIVADELAKQPRMDNVLYVSEDGFEEPFSPQRAISRNRCIHALGLRALVAQSSLKSGGTWDGTVKNLRFGWSPVYCFGDGSEAAALLNQMGAQMIATAQLTDLVNLPQEDNFFESMM